MCNGMIKNCFVWFSRLEMTDACVRP